jgi:cobalt-zinc-cadmium efflux system membrane fusion protein
VLRAPIEGTVISRHATVGAVAQPGGDPLIEIGNPTALWVVAEVFERELAQVRDHAEVDLELPTRVAPVPGHVVSVGSALTGALRTAPVYIGFDAPDVDVRAGMFARAAIKAPAATSIAVPAAPGRRPPRRIGLDRFGEGDGSLPPIYGRSRSYEDEIAS